ncbi:hypothetical protein BaRGS_00040591, partial [Batillaria attramentaria]
GLKVAASRHRALVSRGKTDLTGPGQTTDRDIAVLLCGRPDSEDRRGEEI